MLYIEVIRQAVRKFMSAARAAARNKPVMAIKAGRSAKAAKAAASHTGALAGTDAVYDAAFDGRACCASYDLDEMFDRGRKPSPSSPPRQATVHPDQRRRHRRHGRRRVIEIDGKLAELSPGTIEKLDVALSSRPHSNPVQIRHGNGEHYVKALDILLEASEVDSLLVMHAPTALTSASEIAEQVVIRSKPIVSNVMTCWVGQEQAGPARRLLREAGIPTYETPGAAVRAFMHLVNYRKNQEMLMETPASAWRNLRRRPLARAWW